MDYILQKTWVEILDLEKLKLKKRFAWLTKDEKDFLRTNFP